jgi:hypothetical protein
MMMTNSFVILNEDNAIPLHLGKYDTNPLWHDLDMWIKSSYNEIIEVWEWNS